ncbi:unnamed protein product [Rhizoctonia solani]|uniref:RNA 3'-terminal phosphate cyclase domain-containing protein n=1 Tax=Rhizoctonia solani TaxID=456999 RepID=A0A8H2XZM7_9AGAM|nr:unnamed protein product [Rhizoctonia solani]
MPSTTTPNLVRFTGHNYFRQRITLSILSGKAVRIDGIRPDDQNPGLRDFEASFLRLIEKVTNGSAIEISYTGTSVLIKPGIISGGSVTHECPLSRSIGYFLEPLVAIAPFSKKALDLTLKGITSDEKDLSVDLIRTVTLPHLTLFGISDGVELKIKKRGAAPLGGGEIEFICPVVKQLQTLNFIDPGKIIRIRGIAEDVGRCRMGELTVKSVQFLRDIKQFFGTSFKVVPAPDSDSELMLSCFGTGYINSNKAVS